jgi:hypothetical protein
MKEIVTDSIRYWEPRRLAYNAVLALVVVVVFFKHHSTLAGVTWQQGAVLLVMAVIANLLYCAAYVADIFAQCSDFQAAWKRQRWLLWAAGTALSILMFLLSRG